MVHSRFPVSVLLLYYPGLWWYPLFSLLYRAVMHMYVCKYVCMNVCVCVCMYVCVCRTARCIDLKRRVNTTHCSMHPPAHRGVFGTHTAFVLRRLRRLCRYAYGSTPRVAVTSATVANPAAAMRALLGLSESPLDAAYDRVVVVEEDGSPHGASKFVLWNPPLAQQVCILVLCIAACRAHVLVVERTCVCRAGGVGVVHSRWRWCCDWHGIGATIVCYIDACLLVPAS